MSFKDQRRREKFRKKTQQGFRGYPVATVAYYGPTDQRASKVVASIISAEGAEPEMRKWLSESADVRRDPEIGQELLLFIDAHGPKSVVLAERIMGCPHEEGIDYPEGEYCPRCPFWRNRDRFSGHVIQ